MSFEEVTENFVWIHEADPMQTYLDMGYNYIYNVNNPINNDQGANKGYVHSAITDDYKKSRRLI